MDKNEKNNLIDTNTPRNNSDSEDNHHNNNNDDDNDIVLLTPEQQKKLEKHLTPPSLPISDDYNLTNNNKFDLNKDNSNNNDEDDNNNNNNNNNSNNNNNNNKNGNDDNNNNSNNSGDNDSGDEEKKKKKKKKDKKKNKKNKDQDDIVDSEDIDNVVIQSPMLLKSKKNRENYQDNQYTTEMSPMDSNGNVKVLNSTTPQIEVDPEMYFDGGEKKEKKKKKKNGGGGGNKDKFLTPEERRIKENSKDAKSFFSNERTFLSWIGLTFSLGAIGTAIITWFGSEGVSLATGVFLWAISMVFMVYSTMQFRRRGHAIRTKTQGPFDDQKGPLSLVAMVVIGVSIYLVFFVVIRPTVNIGGDGGNNSTKSL
ncbi:hypothetical protein ACTFIZ_003862 [Dictyostelium cf. discoideum]